MYILLITLPLLGTFFSGICGHLLGFQGVIWLSLICICFTFFLSCFIFYEITLGGSFCYIEMFNWFNSELLTFSWSFLFDSLTAVMLVVVTSISMCVHLYSTEYMAHDPHFQRFMAYLSLFTFFMLVLVTAENFFQLFLGWEGVGLCSYLLVNFWYGRIQANKAALKAMVVNRIGDIGLALGLFLIYYLFQSLEYSIIFSLTSVLQQHFIWFLNYDINAITLICFCFFIAATGKSAQVGLHTWLPDAMEGPTPVSALIHAATMVTAGIFLIVRSSPLFEYAPNVSLIITLSGAMTAFIAASIGLVQNDLKRVIAYSTCSQLGYMMIACGTSGYAVSIFHLTNHAFFKALLFLSAGAIIHAISNEQDMRKMGGLLQLLPFTYSMIFIGSLSLMGFPFLTGFYSKDLILEWTFSNFSVKGFFAYWLGAFSAFFTAFYSIRLLALTFLKKPSIRSKQIFTVLHEVPFKMGFPLFFLSFFSIFIGYLLKDMFVGMGTDFWGHSIFILPMNFLIFESEFLQTYFKIFPVCLSFLGALFAYFIFSFYSYFKKIFFFKFSKFGIYLYNFLNRKWYFDKLYNFFFSQTFLNFGYKYSYQNIDRGILENFGSIGIYSNLFFKSNFITNFYNKNLLSNFKFKTPFLIIFSSFFTLIIICLYFYAPWFHKFLDIFLITSSINKIELNFKNFQNIYNIIDYPINMSNNILYLFNYTYYLVNFKISEFFGISPYKEFGRFSDFFFVDKENTLIEHIFKEFYSHKLYRDWLGLGGFFHLFGLDGSLITVSSEEDFLNPKITWPGYFIVTKELLSYYNDNFCMETNSFVQEMVDQIISNQHPDLLNFIKYDYEFFYITLLWKTSSNLLLEYLFYVLFEILSKF